MVSAMGSNEPYWCTQDARFCSIWFHAPVCAMQRLRWLGNFVKIVAAILSMAYVQLLGLRR
jgi:hypothetical protein